MLSAVITALQRPQRGSTRMRSWCDIEQIQSGTLDVFQSTYTSNNVWAHIRSRHTSRAGVVSSGAQRADAGPCRIAMTIMSQMRAT